MKYRNWNTGDKVKINNQDESFGALVKQYPKLPYEDILTIVIKPNGIFLDELPDMGPWHPSWFLSFKLIQFDN